MFTQRFASLGELVDSVAQMGDGTGFKQPFGDKYTVIPRTEYLGMSLSYLETGSAQKHGSTDQATFVHLLERGKCIQTHTYIT